jgi:hypothetical protein
VCEREREREIIESERLIPFVSICYFKSTLQVLIASMHIVTMVIYTTSLATMYVVKLRVEIIYAWVIYHTFSFPLVKISRLISVVNL